MITQNHSNKHFIFLYIGLICITLAFINKYIFASHLLFYIFLCSGIACKIIFLLYSLNTFSHLPFRTFLPLLMGVLFIAVSMYVKYIIHNQRIAYIFLYLAIPLKIFGIILLIKKSKKEA